MNFNYRTHLRREGVWIGVLDQFKGLLTQVNKPYQLLQFFSSLYKHLETQIRDHMQLWMQQHSLIKIKCNSHAHVPTLPNKKKSLKTVSN